MSGFLLKRGYGKKWARFIKPHQNDLQKKSPVRPGTDVKDYYYSRDAGEGLEPSFEVVRLPPTSGGSFIPNPRPRDIRVWLPFHHPALYFLSEKKNFFVSDVNIWTISRKSRE